MDELEDINQFNELYFVCLALQIKFKLNSRELSKKLNQYALLRQDDGGKNLILLLLLFIEKGGLLDYFQSIEQVIKKINQKLYPNIINFIGKYPQQLKQNVDIKNIPPEEWFMQILRLDYQIDDSIMYKFMRGYRTVQNAQKNEFYESNALKFFNKYSIRDLETSDHFFQMWIRYID